MTENNTPPVWQMVRAAVEALGGKTTNVAVRDWILEHYPGTNKSTIQCQIIFCTVNHDSRVHYPENHKTRKADTRYDFLFRTGRGQLELYDPAKHGQWEIYERDDGRLGVRQVDSEVPPDDAGPGTEGGSSFAAQAHLRDYLAQHLDQIQPGLQLYVDEDGTSGVEYPTASWRHSEIASRLSFMSKRNESRYPRGPVTRLSMQHSTARCRSQRWIRSTVHWRVTTGSQTSSWISSLTMMPSTVWAPTETTNDREQP